MMNERRGADGAIAERLEADRRERVRRALDQYRQLVDEARRRRVNLRPPIVSTVALVLALFVAACGGDDDSDAGGRWINYAPDNVPACDELFADGATLPAAMPDLCEQTTGDISAVVSFDCADGRKLYQVDTSDGQAWAFSEGLVSNVPEVSSDSEYAAAYEDCQS